MLKPKSTIIQIYIFMGLIVILLMAVASYVYTGNVTSGVQPMLEEKLSNPITDKVDSILEDAFSALEFPETNSRMPKD